MLIKSLQMENFRQFKGITKINFSCDPVQNVTIILGDNSFGKTTLLQAFNWCFYGNTTFNDEPNFLLNKEIEYEMRNGKEQFVRVTIELLQNEIDYTIIREQKYTWLNGAIKGLNPIVTLNYKMSDGQTKVKSSERDADELIYDIINSILPQQLSTYFFFDTERVNTIATRKDLSRAVKDFLGLSVIENAIYHLGDKDKKRSVIGKLFNGMDRGNEEKERRARESINVAESKIEIINSQLDECKTQIKNYEDKRKELEDFLKENQDTAELQRKRTKIEKEILNQNQLLENITNSYFKKFNRNALQFFVQPFIIKAEEILKDFKLNKDFVPILSKSAILKLIENGKCICGREICRHSEAYNNLINELNNITSDSTDIVISNYLEKLHSFSGSSADMIYNDLQEMVMKVSKIKNDIEDLEDELQKISDKINSNFNMGIKEKELSNVKNRIQELNSKKDRLNIDKGIQMNVIKENNNILEQLIITSEKNKQTQLLIDYAIKIRDKLNNIYKKEEDIKRQELEEEVKLIFKKMYHGNRSASINKEYQVTLLTNVADEMTVTGESEGLSRVKSFAFIAGLISIAKKTIINDLNTEGFNLSSEPYPLVMDAPFSNADEIHIANISEILPEVAEQVIMFVMQKDWHYAEPVMKNHVGKKYILEKINETFTRLKAGDENV